MKTFHELYRSTEEHFFEYLESLQPNTGVSKPILIDFPNDYDKSRKNLLVVGQQTHSWFNDKIVSPTNRIDDLMKDYRNTLTDFINGERKSPFWRAVQEFHANLDVNIFWGNLNKIDIDKKRPSHEIENVLSGDFPFLQREIEIIQPYAVLFFTGPNYDDLIKKIFKGVQFEQVPESGYIDRKLAKVIMPGVLPEKSYRAYHPNYVQRSRLWEKGYIELLKNLIR